jgi:peptide methionine sulfoxide reductase MsrB
MFVMLFKVGFSNVWEPKIVEQAKYRNMYRVRRFKTGICDVRLDEPRLIHVFKPHTHTLYILRYCINIVYLSYIAKIYPVNAICLLK